MKYFTLFILSLIMITNSDAQKVTRPVCDEAVNWDYGFNYSGFIIQEANGSPLSQVQSRLIQIFISDINDPSATTFSETHRITLDRTGYFNIEIGSVRTRNFSEFVDSMNSKENAEYVMEVSLNSNGNSVIIGSKKLLTVPYALVSNALGGLGKQGKEGNQGPQGPQGARGLNGFQGDGQNGTDGQDGANGFGIMKMRNTLSNFDKFYVDDGTNTSDGKPHIRYNNNGVWIDL